MSEENTGEPDAPEEPTGSAPEDEAEALPNDGALESAMQDAVRAVEARQRDDDEGEEPTAAHRQEEGKSGALAEAVTEAIVKAKQELEQVLKQTQTEAKELREKWMRAAADLENYRKRAQREREDATKFGNERLLKDFLPILDDLDRAIDVVTVEEGSPGAQLLNGMRLVQKKFLAQLERNHVTTFSTNDQTFDPNRHEAVQQVNSDQDAGKIASELQRGFLLNDRLLRPALVTVSLGPEPSSDGAEATEEEKAEELSDGA